MPQENEMQQSIAHSFDTLCAAIENRIGGGNWDAVKTFDFEDEYKALHFMESDRHPLVDLLGGGPCLLLVLKDGLSPITSSPRTEVYTSKKGRHTYNRVLFTCKPVSYSVGRAIVSEYMRWRDGCTHTAIDRLPFWVYARQVLPQRTAFLGGLYHRTASSKTNVVRSIQCDECKIHDLPTIDQCLGYFQHSGAGEPEVTASATYDLLRPVSGDTTPSGLQIHARWPRPTDMLSPPGANATVTLTFQIEPGCSSSPVYGTYREVQALQRVYDLYTAKECEATAQCGHTQHKGDDYSSESVQLTLAAFFGAMEEAEQPRASRNSHDTDYGMTAECGTSLFKAQPANVRRDHHLDFLDYLWTLVCANGWENNSAVLSQVIAAVCERVQARQLAPRVHEDNPCVLAKLLRRMTSLPQKKPHRSTRTNTTTDMDKEKHISADTHTDTHTYTHTGAYEDTLVMRAVEELHDRDNALRCVLDMGLEKIQRDVSHCLIHRGLAIKEELAGLVDRVSDVGARLKQRKYLYHIYELVAAGSSAALTQNILREVVSAAIMHYATITDDSELAPGITIQCASFSATERYLKTLCTTTRFRNWSLNITGPMDQHRSAVPGMGYSLYSHSVLPTVGSAGDVSDDEDSGLLNMAVDMGAVTVHRFVEKYQVHSWSR